MIYRLCSQRFWRPGADAVLADSIHEGRARVVPGESSTADSCATCHVSYQACAAIPPKLQAKSKTPLQWILDGYGQLLIDVAACEELKEEQLNLQFTVARPSLNGTAYRMLAAPAELNFDWEASGITLRNACPICNSVSVLKTTDGLVPVGTSKGEDYFSSSVWPSWHFISERFLDALIRNNIGPFAAFRLDNIPFMAELMGAERRLRDISRAVQNGIPEDIARCAVDKLHSEYRFESQPWRHWEECLRTCQN